MWDPWAESEARADLGGRLKWFLLGRVAVISCFLCVVAIGYLGRGQQGYLVSIQSLLYFVALTYAVTLVSALLIERVHDLERFTYCQLTIDLLLITGAIYLTSGIDSPFAFLYSLAVINGAVLLFASGAAFAAVLATVLYDTLLVALATGLIDVARPHDLPPIRFDGALVSRIVTTNLTFFLTAFLSAFLARRIFDAEQQLEYQSAERERMAMLKDSLAQAIGSALVTTDVDGRILGIEGTEHGIFDSDHSSALRGRDLGDVFPALKLTPTARLRFLQSPGAVEPIEFAYEPKGSAPKQLRCSTAPLRDTFGHPIGALYVLQDISDLQRINTPPEAESTLAFSAAAAEHDSGSDGVGTIEGLCGRSAAIVELRKLISRVADSDATILVTGESGTGKEVVARAIHAQGPRREKHFVAINCGAIPENLIESELFGHVKGAFTGASADRAGSFRMADGGTIFLDEIGELPLHLQVKLLRVLQERTFRPIGSEKTVAVNVRIVAATNRDLPGEVAAGRFREDLYYRLNVIELTIPPLRERREDVPLLVRHFLAQFASVYGRTVVGFSADTARVLLEYDFPGNVRELENIVEHALALCDSDTVETRHLPSYLANGRAPGHSAVRVPRGIATIQPTPLPHPHPPVWQDVDLERDLAEYEKSFLLRALDEAGGVKKRAAELLGINYRSLRHRLQKYGLGDVDQDPSTVQ